MILFRSIPLQILNYAKKSTTRLITQSVWASYPSQILKLEKVDLCMKLAEKWFSAKLWQFCYLGSVYSKPKFAGFAQLAFQNFILCRYTC